MKKIWYLVTNVDDILNNYGWRVFERPRDKDEIIVVDYADLVVESGKDTRFRYRGKELERPDVFRSSVANTDSYALEKLLEEAGARSLLDLDEMETARSKIRTYQRLASNGIRVPKTVVFFNHPDKEHLVEEIGFPMVVKPDSGFGGEGVELIRDEKELDEYLKKLQYGQAYMAQEFIANSFGKDLRVIMLDGDFMMAMKRQAGNPEEFRSNIHQGGSFEYLDIDDETLELCKKIASLYDLPVLGIDLLFGDDEYVVTEVNAQPGIPDSSPYKARMEAAFDKRLEKVLGELKENDG